MDYNLIRCPKCRERVNLADFCATCGLPGEIDDEAYEAERRGAPLSSSRYKKVAQRYPLSQVRPTETQATWHFSKVDGVGIVRTDYAHEDPTVPFERPPTLQELRHILVAAKVQVWELLKDLPEDHPDRLPKWVLLRDLGIKLHNG